VSSFQSIFTAEGVFHREAAKTKTQMNDLMDGLIQDMSTGTYTTKRPYPVTSENQVSDSDDMDSQTTSSHAESGDTVVCNDEAVATETAEDGTVEKVVDGGDALNPFTHSDHDEQDGVSAETVTRQQTQERPRPIPAARPPPPQAHSTGKKAGDKPEVAPLPVTEPAQPQDDSSEKGSPSNEEAVPLTAPQTEGAQPQLSQQPSQQSSQQQQQEVATTEIPGMLYKVRAAYKYIAEDDDELSFEKGEIISVIEFEDPEEQDEGWLLGILELSGIKGVFPANFTKRI